MALETLAVFSPLPPEQNGIADYSYHLLSALKENLPCEAYVARPDGVAPSGVKVREARQAFRHMRHGRAILHQIGNNPGHVFVLEALRTWGGVTTLHDQNLHYLYEVANSSRAVLTRNMQATAAGIGAVYAHDWFGRNVKTQANYALFDMLDEVLTLSSAVVVHSAFARARIRTLYGADKAAKVRVVPHLALPFHAPDAAAVLARFGVPVGAKLILTSGFATFAKRFDWLVAALDELAFRGVPFFWLHAGKERAEEYDLSGVLARYEFELAASSFGARVKSPSPIPACWPSS